MHFFLADIMHLIHVMVWYQNRGADTDFHNNRLLLRLKYSRESFNKINGVAEYQLDMFTLSSHHVVLGFPYTRFIILKGHPTAVKITGRFIESCCFVCSVCQTYTWRVFYFLINLLSGDYC